LSESEALEFFRQYVAGYKHLYESKIIHRDIKPENLMLHNGKNCIENRTNSKREKKKD